MFLATRGGIVFLARIGSTEVLDESHALAWSAIVAGLLDVALVRHASDEVVPTLVPRVIICDAVSRVIVFGVGIPLGGRRRCDGVLWGMTSRRSVGCT